MRRLALAAAAVGLLAAALVDGRIAGAQEPPARAAPPDRYDVAGGCWAVADGGASLGPVRLQAVDLGRYLVVLGDGRFAGDDHGALVRADGPSEDVVWDATDEATGVVLRTPSGGELPVAGPATGCVVLADVATGVTGPPLRGASPVDEVQGYLDSHLHLTAFEFLGGQAHCGRPWHPYGVTYALVDCPDHQIGGGSLAILDNILAGKDLVAPHDPVGWPTFRDWPAPHSLTHEQTYHRWVERAWRGGLRMIVNLFTDNRVLCEVYPLKENSCDEMASVRLQVQRLHELVRYVDAQHGGPGEGWLRVVDDPYEARAVINEGKLAVVLGIEISEPFGCRDAYGVAACTAADIDRQVDELHALGIRQMFAIHKFDNALGGVTGDGGGVGPFINGGNFLSTGHFIDMRTCDEADTGAHDNHQDFPADLGEPADVVGALLAGLQPLGVPAVPPYPAGNHCNARGLTDLGRHALRTMVDRGVLIDVDHMSVRSRQEALSIIEAAGYPGVVSSHSWITPDAVPRVLAAGGMVSPYAGDATSFAASWRRLRALVPEGERFGLGYGADSNGLGNQGDPRGGPDPVSYPFTGLGGVVVDRQVTGSRTFDVNVDGVSHYGLYPDWIEDLRHLAGDQIVEDLAQGAETYLRLWERVDGVAATACPTPGLAEVVPGLPAEEVLRRTGQPMARLEGDFTYCDAVVRFGADGTVAGVEDRAEASAPSGRRALPATGGPGLEALGAALLAGAAMLWALQRGNERGRP